MTMVGGVIETKDIGINITLNGEFFNTELIDGKIRLKLKSGSQTEYEPSGYWISQVVNIGDNFKDFDKLLSQIQIDGNSEVEVSTRTSGDGVTFNSWTLTGDNNEVLSIKNRYVQVRVVIKAGTEIAEFLILDNTTADISNFISKELLEVNEGLKLKTNFEFDMSLDSTWTDEGSLHRKAITREEWLRIDKMNVLRGGK